MDKSQIRELFSRYQQGTATPREKRMVDAYMLMGEAEKANFFDEEKTVIKERIWAAIKPVPASLRKPGIRWMKVAALWALLIGTAITGYLLREPLLDRISPLAIKTIETGPYEIKQLALPDGSHVTLAQNSRISFPVRYRRSRRNALLNGTAFFDIKQDATAPFSVQSGDLDIQVLGTSFEVADPKSGYEASVTVLTGKVQVNQGAQKLAILSGNQQVKYDKFSRQSNIKYDVDATAATSWTQQQLVFEEVPLTVVMKTLQVYYGMRITVANGTLKESDTFSGSFNRNETRKNVLEVICFSSGLSYSLLKDSTVIIKR